MLVTERREPSGVAVHSAQNAAERTGLQVNISPLLLSSVVAAVAATVALVIVAVIQSRPPGPPPGPGQMPPPTPPSDVMLIVTTGVFTVAWLAVIVVYCRDQILRRIGELEERFAALTAEYGEQRETDGYLHGMRVPTQPGHSGPPGAVRPLHPVPPHE